MRRQNTGQIRILEAFLAVLIIFSSFAFSANLPASQNKASRNDLGSLGLQSLVKLDSEGSLGILIDEANWTVLRDSLSLVLPAGVSFNLTVYDAQMRQINSEIISNGAFNSQEVAFVEYLCISRNPVFSCYIINLRLAVAS